MIKIAVVIPWREQPSRKHAYDKLIEWYQHFFPGIEIISSDSNSVNFNLSAARNSGAAKAIEADADIIIFNDADTFVKPQQLQHAVAHAESFNEIAAPYSQVCQHSLPRETGVFFKQIYFKDNEIALGKVFAKPGIGEDGIPTKLWPCSGVIVVPVNIFQKIGGFMEDIEGWGPEDILFHKMYFEIYNKMFVYIDGMSHSTYNDPSWRKRNSKNKKYVELAKIKAS